MVIDRHQGFISGEEPVTESQGTSWLRMGHMWVKCPCTQYQRKDLNDTQATFDKNSLFIVL